MPPSVSLNIILLNMKLDIYDKVEEVEFKCHLFDTLMGVYKHRYMILYSSFLIVIGVLKILICGFVNKNM